MIELFVCMKKILLILIVLAHSLYSYADAIQFQASAPRAIAVGEVFRLVYSVNAKGGKDLRVADMPEFDVVAGPFESYSSKVQVVNGSVDTSVTTSYTYNLIAKKEGLFTIPAASIVLEKKKHTSNAIKIKVLPADEKSKADAARSNNSQQSMSEALSDKNIFVRAIPSRTKLYEQDYLLITYKLYSVVNVVGFDRSFPDFKGFLKQKIDLPNNSQWGYENYKGKNYNTVVIYQALLYPQSAGKIKIDKTEIEAVVRVRKKAQVRSIFDNFFDSYQDVKKKLKVPPITINVKELPSSKPSSFNGAVGSLSFKSDITSKNVSVNDAITLKYTISGNGNLKLIQLPDIEFPADFEVYDPKVTNNLTNTTQGVKGSKTIEYLIIPRNEGDFKIPSYKFSYFDVKRGRYKEISSPEYRIHVKKGDGSNTGGIVNYNNQEQLKLLGTDIRYIITDKLSISKKNEFLFGTFIYWLFIIIPIILSIALFVIYRKQLKRNSDLVLVKNRKAKKVAIKRLKTANSYLHTDQKELFYEEVLKALWGYLSHKLIIPVSDLSKENIETELEKRKVEETNIREFMDVIVVCEFERYSPSHDSQIMGDLYNRAINIISKFQQSIK